MADALSMKNHGKLSSLRMKEYKMYGVIEDIELYFGWEKQGPCLYSMSVRPMIIQRVVEEQVHDELLERVKSQLTEGKAGGNLSMHVNGSIRFKWRLCVPKNVELRN